MASLVPEVHTSIFHDALNDQATQATTGDEHNADTEARIG